ncbi:MAG: hypothetical protein AAF716_00315 [Cyanobacteria bacterium P01_D01_bin.1]
MNLVVAGNKVKVQLDPSERFWAFHLSGQIELPLDSIQDVRLVRPETEWNELRAPGTYVPGLIKAGTYYTTKGREFWYVPKNQDTNQSCLCVDVSEGYYKRIVLGSVMARQWQSQIQAATV